MWWEHGGARKMAGGTPATVPIFYRIKIEQIPGRRAASEQEVLDTKQAKADPDEQEWLRNILRRVRQT